MLPIRRTRLAIHGVVAFRLDLSLVLICFRVFLKSFGGGELGNIRPHSHEPTVAPSAPIRRSPFAAADNAADATAAVNPIIAGAASGVPVPVW